MDTILRSSFINRQVGEATSYLRQKKTFKSCVAKYRAVPSVASLLSSHRLLRRGYFVMNMRAILGDTERVLVTIHLYSIPTYILGLVYVRFKSFPFRLERL